MRRVYQYVIDLHGRLFVENHRGASLLRQRPLTDQKFLAMFWRNLQKSGNLPVNVNEKNITVKELAQEYPFVSICAGELNFVRALDTPIVFEELAVEQNLLYFAGMTRSCKFDSCALILKPSTNRLYHRVTDLDLAEKLGIANGLIQTHLAQKIAANIEFQDDDQMYFSYKGSKNLEISEIFFCKLRAFRKSMQTAQLVRLEILTANSQRLNKSKSLPNIKRSSLSSIPEEETLQRFTDKMAEKYDNEMNRRSLVLKRISTRYRRDGVLSTDRSLIYSSEGSTKSESDKMNLVAGAISPELDSPTIVMHTNTANNVNIDLDDEQQLEEEDVPQSPIKLNCVLPFENKPVN